MRVTKEPAKHYYYYYYHHLAAITHRVQPYYQEPYYGSSVNAHLRGSLELRGNLFLFFHHPFKRWFIKWKPQLSLDESHLQQSFQFLLAAKPHVAVCSKVQLPFTAEH